jgi:hypothetical protein
MAVKMSLKGHLKGDTREALALLYCEKNTKWSNPQHSPEALPDMTRAGRENQICLYCHRPIQVILIDNVFRHVNFRIIEWP